MSITLEQFANLTDDQRSLINQMAGKRILKSGQAEHLQQLEAIVHDPNFRIDAIYHVARLMIQRGSEGMRADDAPRAHVISLVPCFLSYMRNINNLQHIAIRIFSQEPYVKEILEVLQNSFASTMFKANLERACNKFENKEFESADVFFRKALAIIPQAKSEVEKAKKSIA